MKLYRKILVFIYIVAAIALAAHFKGFSLLSLSPDDMVLYAMSIVAILSAVESVVLGYVFAQKAVAVDLQSNGKAPSAMPKGMPKRDFNLMLGALLAAGGILFNAVLLIIFPTTTIFYCLLIAILGSLLIWMTK